MKAYHISSFLSWLLANIAGWGMALLVLIALEPIYYILSVVGAFCLPLIGGLLYGFLILITTWVIVLGFQAFFIWRYDYIFPSDWFVDGLKSLRFSGLLLGFMILIVLLVYWPEAPFSGGDSWLPLGSPLGWLAGEQSMLLQIPFLALFVVSGGFIYRTLRHKMVHRVVFPKHFILIQVLAIAAGWSAVLLYFYFFPLEIVYTPSGHLGFVLSRALLVGGAVGLIYGICSWPSMNLQRPRL